MATFTPSPYQQRIYDFIESGTGNAVINAVAGSGKTTTLINLLAKVPATSRVLFLAFNKSIVEELKIKTQRFPNVEVKTLHSLGMSGLRKGLANFKDVNSGKYRQYLNEQMKLGLIAPTRELAPGEKGEYKDNILDLVDLARVNLCQTTEEMMQVTWKHNIHLHDNELMIAQRLIIWGRSEEGMVTADFTDMIYYPNYDSSIRFFQYDLVLIDECQDLNAAQRGMFLKTIKKGGGFVAVGDPKQAIYGFAGADVESFNLLKNLPNTIELPLSVCYRCDREIIKLAQSEVPQIQWRDGADAGIVNMESLIADVQDGDMVLCRNSAPLAKLCMQYIANGVKAYIKGRDIGMNLIKMLERTNKVRLNDAIKSLDKELERIKNKVIEKTGCTEAEVEKTDAYASYYDKIRAIEVLGEGLSKVKEVCDRIDAVFSDNDKRGICLSTIHKSKGLESERVFILCPDKLLPKRAMQVAWMAEQEHNLVYVAYTRAKHYLGFIKDFKMD